MAITKAELIVEGGGKIKCQFNPTEYSVNNSVRYSVKNIPGSQESISQFISGESPTLSLSLMFDTYIPKTLNNPVESGMDVTLYTKKVVELTHIKGSLHRPPIVTFSWGSINFRGIITDVKQKFTMFLPTGVPVRATLDVTFRAASDNEYVSKLSPLESPDRTKYKVVKEGEYLWNYAMEEYGDPSMWRVIAKENNIMNPLDIYPGQVIKLPAIIN